MGTLNKNIVIATHSLVYGAPQALRDYLKNKISDVSFIEHPLFGNLMTWSFGLVDTFWHVIKQRKRIDIYVGVDPVNAVVGVFLKRLGLISYLIYYTIDYVPQRFSHLFLNDLYHFLDKICLTVADETWNVSPRIAEAREKFKGLNCSVYNRQKVVPIGVWYDKVQRLPFAKIKRHQLFFLGHLLESAGVQFVIQAIPTIIKEIPDFHFLIVGGGEYEKILRDLVKKLKLEKYVTFTGWIKDRKKLDVIMADSAVAVALYDKKTSKTTHFSDPTKLKDYLSAGLPIILTNLPHNAKEIEEKGCGIIIDYNPNEVSKAICQLMMNKTKLHQYRINALKMAKQYDWHKIYDNHFLPLLK